MHPSGAHNERAVERAHMNVVHVTVYHPIHLNTTSNNLNKLFFSLALLPSTNTKKITTMTGRQNVLLGAVHKS